MVEWIELNIKRKDVPLSVKSIKNYWGKYKSVAHLYVGLSMSPKNKRKQRPFTDWSYFLHQPGMIPEFLSYAEEVSKFGENYQPHGKYAKEKKPLLSRPSVIHPPKDFPLQKVELTLPPLPKSLQEFLKKETFSK